jgi:outer membrane cobalamin receptor
MTSVPIREKSMFPLKQKSAVLAAAAVALCVAPPGAAQSAEREASPSDTTRVVAVDPVVVTVTHLEVLRSRIPNSVAIVTREQLEERGASSVLAVVNERVPGVFVTQRGVLGYGVAQGAAGRISIRGAGSAPNTQLLVMTDGRPQMMGLMGHPIADTHMSSGVERVEIVRGPSSVLHGTGAMGGVVNVITRRDWTPGLGLDGGVTYGTHNTQQLEAAVRYGHGTHSGVSLAANRYTTDGHRPSASFRIDNLSARGSTQLRPGLSLMVDAAVSDLLTYDPGPATTPREDNWVDILRGTSGVSLENRGGRWSGATKLFFNFGRHEIHDGFFSRDHAAGLQLHQGLRLGERGTLTIGGDAKRFGGRAENARRSVDWGAHEVTEYGAFAMVHHPLAAGVVATGGVRLNHHGTYGLEVAPQAGVAVPVFAQTTLKASSARGFRSPTIRELHLFPAPNPELQPERAWSNEASLLHGFGPRASLELAVYRTEGSNLIRTVGAPPNLTLSNSGRFLHRGGELTLNAALAPGVGMDVSYGYLDVGELTLAHPKHQLFGSIRYTTSHFTSSVGIQHVAGLHGADGRANRLPDYTVANARFGIGLARGVGLFVAGENLLDEQYEVMPGYPMPGRVLSIGVNTRGR